MPSSWTPRGFTMKTYACSRSRNASRYNTTASSLPISSRRAILARTLAGSSRHTKTAYRFSSSYERYTVVGWLTGVPSPGSRWRKSVITTPRPPSPVSMERWRGPPSVWRWSRNWSRWGGDETRLIWTMRAGCCAWERGAATTNAPSKRKNLTGTSSDLLQQPGGFAQEHPSPRAPVVLAPLQLTPGETQQRRYPVPDQGVAVQERPRPGQKHRCCARRRPRPGRVEQPGSRHRGQEHGGVEFQRSLSKVSPVDHTHSVVLIQHVPVVQRPVYESWHTVTRLRVGQRLAYRARGGSERGVRGDELGDAPARLAEHVPRAQLLAEGHRQRARALEPARGQLPSTLALPRLQQLVRRGSVEPTDDEHPEVLIADEQGRDPGARAASQTGRESSIRLGLGRRVRGIGLDDEATVAGADGNRGSRARRVTTERQLDAATVQTEGWDRSRQAQCAARPDPRQSRIVTKVDGGLRRAACGLARPPR